MADEKKENIPETKEKKENSGNPEKSDKKGGLKMPKTPKIDFNFY